MSLSNNLLQAVSTRDIKTIRDCLAASIVFDMNMTKGFQESLQYCLDNGISENELYEKHDDCDLERPETFEAFSSLCGELGTNFSRERIDAIRRLGRKLSPPADNSLTKDIGKASPESKKSGESMLPLIGLAIGGAIVGGILGSFVFRKALIGAVAGGAAGGVIGAMLGKSKRSDASQ